jgi:hypothetical protein
MPATARATIKVSAMRTNNDVNFIPVFPLLKDVFVVPGNMCLNEKTWDRKAC